MWSGDRWDGAFLLCRGASASYQYGDDASHNEMRAHKTLRITMGEGIGGDVLLTHAYVESAVRIG